MRGDDPKAGDMWSYRTPEQRVPQDHPLRAVRVMTERALRELDPLFDRLYARTGRPSIPPEQLLRALLLQLLYSVRSERLLMERLDYDLLFRWFVGLSADDPVWHVSVFTKNRERLLRGEVAQAFFDAVLRQARERDLLSDEHFSVDGTLVEAWAGHKSFRRKDEGRPRGRQWRRELPRHAAAQRHPSEHDRPRGAAVPQGRQPARGAQLPRARAHGEPLRPRGRRHAHCGDRVRRA